MSIDTTEDIVGIYDNSVMPAAVSVKGGLRYTNPPFDRLFDRNDDIFSNLHTGRAYDKIIFRGSRPYKVFVTPLNEKESLVNISEGAVFDDYSKVLCAAVRHAVSKVSKAADDLAGICGNEESAALLNTIDSTMLTLLSEFLIPEQLTVLRSAKIGDYSSVSVSAAVRDLAENLSDVLAKHSIPINAHVLSGLYATVDTRAINLLLTDYAVRCMEGEAFVEAIAVNIIRHRPDAFRLTLSCGHLGRPSVMRSEAVSKPPDHLPHKELERLICEKFRCTVSYNEKPEYSAISVDIPMDKAPITNMVRAPLAKYGKKIHFTDENIFLSRFGVNPRYDKNNGNINE